MATEISVIGKELDLIKPVAVALQSRNLPSSYSKEQIQALVDNEIINLDYLAFLNPKLLECAPVTIKQAFKSIIMMNLSFEPSLGLVYVTTRNFKRDVLQPDKSYKTEVYTVMEAKPTVNGEVSIYRMNGVLSNVKIKTNFNPKTKLVETVDVDLILNDFQTDGKVKGEKIQKYTITLDDFAKRERASHSQNCSGAKPAEINNTTLNKANKLYSNYYPLNNGAVHSYDNKGGIDPGFAETKALKIALTKARLDKNPYAKKFVDKPIEHIKVVNEQLDDEEEFITYETNESGEVFEAKEETVSKPVAAQVKKQEEVKVDKKEEKEVLKKSISNSQLEITRLKTHKEVMAYYQENIDLIDKNPDLKKFATSRASTLMMEEKRAKDEKLKAEAEPKPQTEEEFKKEIKVTLPKQEINANDL